MVSVFDIVLVIGLAAPPDEVVLLFPPPLPGCRDGFVVDGFGAACALTVSRRCSPQARVDHSRLLKMSTRRLTQRARMLCIGVLYTFFFWGLGGAARLCHERGAFPVAVGGAKKKSTQLVGREERWGVGFNDGKRKE